jgi:hypothetical protein
MSRRAVIFGSWVLLGFSLALIHPVAAVAADAACGDAVTCAEPLDDANGGNNQSGDAGADREPPEDNQKG